MVISGPWLNTEIELKAKKVRANDAIWNPQQIAQSMAFQCNRKGQSTAPAPPPPCPSVRLLLIQSAADASFVSTAAPIINLFPVNHMLDFDQSS